MIVLSPLRKFTFPVNAECINPDVFQGKDIAEIGKLPLFEGNKQKKLGELFKIEEDNQDTPSITIDGDISEVRRIGMGMKSGEILINGNVGMHLGEKMSGGKITLNVNVAQWEGSSMNKGYIFRKRWFYLWIMFVYKFFNALYCAVNLLNNPLEHL